MRTLAYPCVFSRDLANIAKTLKNAMFFKCHRSYLINLKYVEELVKDDGDYLLMSNQKRIPISKSKRDQFLEVVKETFL